MKRLLLLVVLVVVSLPLVAYGAHKPLPPPSIPILVGLDIKGRGIVGKGDEQTACSRICRKLYKK